MTKKIFFILLLFFSSHFFIQAQSFEKGKLVAEVGIGLGIYNTYTLDKQNNSDTTDRAAALVFPVLVEFGITNRIGIGGLFKYSNYIEGNDSNSTVGVNGFDFMLRPAFHFLNKNRIDMSLHANLGGTYISYRDNGITNVQATGFAGIFGGGLDVRMYVSDVFGMFIDYTYNSFSYNNLKLTDNQGTNYFYKIGFNGGNVSTGFVFKIN